MTPYEEGKFAAKNGRPRSDCPHANGSMDHAFWMAGWDIGDRDKRVSSHRETLEAARRDHPVAKACQRVRKVAEGGMINTTYKLSPQPALEAFRADLLLVLGDR